MVMKSYFNHKLLVIFVGLLLMVGVLVGCGGDEVTFTTISTSEGYARLNSETGIVFIDVRTAEEFNAGHAEGSINIPGDELARMIETVVTEKDATIFVICRSGVRSQQAAEILAGLGYVNVYDIGGLLAWPGEISS